MSKNIGGLIVICPEEPRECSICGKFEECRPYGKDGAQVCYACAMKDKKTTAKEMSKRLFGESAVQ